MTMKKKGGGRVVVQGYPGARKVLLARAGFAPSIDIFVVPKSSISAGLAFSSHNQDAKQRYHLLYSGKRAATIILGTSLEGYQSASRLLSGNGIVRSREKNHSLTSFIFKIISTQGC